MFAKWFRQASTIDTLERQKQALERDVEFEQRKSEELTRYLERAEQRVELLEKEIRLARKAEMRTLRHHADVMSKQVKISSFVQTGDKSETAEVQNDVVQPYDERTLWAAQEMMKLDEDMGIIPDTLESYIKIIQADPDKVFV